MVLGLPLAVKKSFTQPMSFRAVEAVMAPLLENGLASGVADVRAVVIGTVAKITKSAGPLLKPHLDKLIPALLEVNKCTELQICLKSRRIGCVIPHCNLQCRMTQPILRTF